MRFSMGWVLIMLLLQGCGTGEMVPENPPDKLTRKYAETGRLFDRELVLFGRPGDKEKILINPYLWQATLDVLRFMGLQQMNMETGLVETAWYTAPEAPAERFKAVATVFAGRIGSEKIRITILSEKKSPQGEWSAMSSAPHLEQSFEEEILVRARKFKSQSLEK